MKRSRRRVHATLAVALGAAVLAAPRALLAEPVHELSLTADNDYFAFRGTDDEYSQGMELALRAPVGADGGAWRHEIVGALGQALYTPDDLLETRPAAMKADRPYAGWLWGSARLDAVGPGVRASLGVRAGWVGPHAFGEEIQIAWHSTNRAPEPLGWPYAQVDDAFDGAVLARAGMLAGWPAGGDGRARLGVDLTPEAGCETGTLRASCDAGVLLRAGLARRGADDVPTLAEPIGARTASAAGRPPFELFGFALLDARRVFSDGVQAGDVCTRSDGAASCEASWVRLSPSVVEVAVGAGFAAGSWRLAASHVWRSAELQAPVVRPQRYGRLTVGWAF